MQKWLFRIKIGAHRFKDLPDTINLQLKYISLNLDRKVFGNEYGYDFLLHTRYICNYFSKAIRKYKYETDGTFNMISIDGSDNIGTPKIVPMSALKITLEFSKEKYAEIRGTAACDYYLELLEKGFKQISKVNIYLSKLAFEITGDERVKKILSFDPQA